MKTLWILLGVLLLSSCHNQPPPSPVSLQAWVQQATGAGEAVLCSKDREGDYFFVARATGDRVRVGSRLNTKQDGVGLSTFSFIKEWKFSNEKGETALTSMPPEILKQADPSGQSPYLESIAYYSLSLANARSIHAQVRVKRCPREECDRSESKGAGEVEYSVDLCDFPVDPTDRSKPE